MRTVKTSSITDLEESVIYCASDVFEELLSKFKSIKDVKFEFCSDYKISNDQVIKAGTPLICRRILKPHGFCVLLCMLFIAKFLVMKLKLYLVNLLC